MITLGLDVGSDMSSLDGSFDGSDYGKLNGLLLGDSMVYTDSKVIVSDGKMQLGLCGGKVIGTIIGSIYGITLSINVGTEGVSLDGSFVVSNYSNFEGLLL